MMKSAIIFIWAIMILFSSAYVLAIETGIYPDAITPGALIYGWANVTGNNSAHEQDSRYCWYINDTVNSCGYIDDILFFNFNNDTNSLLRTVDYIYPSTSQYKTNVNITIRTGCPLFNNKCLRAYETTRLWYNESFFNRTHGTFMFWINYTQDQGYFGPADDFLFWYRDSGQNAFRLQVDNLQIQFRTAAKNVHDVLYGSTCTNKFMDEWTVGDVHHLAFTWNNVTRIMAYYVDGVKVCDNNTYFAPVGSSTSNDVDYRGLAFFRQSNLEGDFDDILLTSEVWSEKRIFDYYTQRREYKGNEVVLDLPPSSLTPNTKVTYEFQACYNQSGCDTPVNASKYISPKGINLTVDFSNPIKTINMTYGLDINYRAKEPLYWNETPKQALRELDADFCRIWLEVAWGSLGYGDGTDAQTNGGYIPPILESIYYGLGYKTVYNYTEFEKMYNGTASACRNVMIHHSMTPSQFTSKSVPDTGPQPATTANTSMFGDYVVNVSYRQCKEYGYCNNQYIGLINEPNANSDWFPTGTAYYRLLNWTITKIRANATIANTKVGMPWGGLRMAPNGSGYDEQGNYMISTLKKLTTNGNITLDWVGQNLYWDQPIWYNTGYGEYGSGDPTRMPSYIYMYHSNLFKTYFDNITDTVHNYYPDAEVWQSETNVWIGAHINNSKHLFFNDFHSAMLATTIHWIMLSNATSYTYFSANGQWVSDNINSMYGLFMLNGSVNYSTSVFGTTNWADWKKRDPVYSIVKLPAYYTYRGFTHYFQSGKSLYNVSSTNEDRLIESLATPEAILLINKRNETISNLSITISNKEVDYLLNNETQTYYRSSGNTYSGITMDPFDVIFLEMGIDGQDEDITIKVAVV